MILFRKSSLLKLPDWNLEVRFLGCSKQKVLDPLTSSRLTEFGRRTEQWVRLMRDGPCCDRHEARNYRRRQSSSINVGLLTPSTITVMGEFRYSPFGLRVRVDLLTDYYQSDTAVTQAWTWEANYQEMSLTESRDEVDMKPLFSDVRQLHGRITGREKKAHIGKNRARNWPYSLRASQIRRARR